MKKFLLIFLILIPNLYAQTETDSVEYIITHVPINLLSTKFEKQINTYNFNSIFRFDKNIDRVNINVLENYNSTFIRSGGKSIRDEQLFSLSASYKLMDYLSVGLLGSSNILSDNRLIEINQASVNNALAFLEISPMEKLTISPFMGYSNNRQIGENDYGYIYGSEGTLSQLDLSDLFLSSDFKFKNEDISPRKNTLRYFNAAATNIFNNDVINNLLVRYSQNRKDFYYAADSVTAQQFNIVNNIQSRIETYYLIEDSLELHNFLSIFSHQEFLGGITWRDVNRDTRYRSTGQASSSIFDTDINELKFEFESNTTYNSDFFNGNLRLYYSERDEKHLTKRFEGINEVFYEERSALESSKNNNSARISISMLGNLNLSETDKLSFSLFQNKLRYDTPSELNFDDRDEILSIARLRYSKMLTPFLEAFVNAEGTYNHIVYILSQRSSNNNVNRIISFSSGGNYRGKNVTSLNNFEVSANYTVYDFEDLNPTNRSFSFRQLTTTDSSIIRLNNTISFVLYGYAKFSEQGDLKWASFSTKPTRFLEEIYSEPKFVFNFRKISFSLGMRIFSLNTYNYKEKEKTIDSKYLSTGPSSEVLLYVQNSLYLRFYGWYEFITIKDNPGKELINLNMQMNWNF